MGFDRFPVWYIEPTGDLKPIRGMVCRGYRKNLGFDRFPVWRIERVEPSVDLKPIRGMVCRDHRVNLKSEGNLIVSPILYIRRTYSGYEYELYPRQESATGPVAPVKFTKTLEPHVIDKLSFGFEKVEPTSFLHLTAMTRHERAHIWQLRNMLMLIRYFMEEVRLQMAALAASEDRETRQKVEELKRYIPQPPNWVEVVPIIFQIAFLTSPKSFIEFFPKVEPLEDYSSLLWGCILIDVIREHGLPTHRAFLNYAGLNQPTTDRECFKKIGECIERATPAFDLTYFKCFRSLDEIKRFNIEKRREISKFRNRLSKLEEFTFRDFLDVAVDCGVVTADELDLHDGRVFKLLEWAIKRKWPLKGFKERVYQMLKLFDKWKYGGHSFTKLEVHVYDFSDDSGGFDRYVWAYDPVLGRFSLGLYVSRAVADQVLRGLKPTCPFQSVNSPQFEHWHCNPGESGICLPECPIKSFKDVVTGYSDGKKRREWLKELRSRMGFLMKEYRSS